VEPAPEFGQLGTVLVADDDFDHVAEFGTRPLVAGQEAIVNTRTSQPIRWPFTTAVPQRTSALHLPSGTTLERPIGPHRRIEWQVFKLAQIKALGQHVMPR
jgi:hypothetical protein